jgi:ElaB/YqjD/DUF883 family membrane-anchored ribosome-binding protein
MPPTFHGFGGRVLGGTQRGILQPMHAPNNDPVSKVADPLVDDLNRIVAQAEELLNSLGSESGEVADAVRYRVSQTLGQARARLAETVDEAADVADTLVDRADTYVRANPWRSVTIAALLGAIATWFIMKPRDRG